VKTLQLDRITKTQNYLIYLIFLTHFFQNIFQDLILLQVDIVNLNSF